MVKMWIYGTIFYLIASEVNRVYSQDDAPAVSDSNRANISGSDLKTSVETSVKPMDLTHSFLVSRNKEHYIKFELSEDLRKVYEKDENIHIFQVNVGCEGEGANEESPIEITVRQNKKIIPFQLPVVQRDADRVLYKSQYKSVDFCPVENLEDTSTVIVTLSSVSTVDVEVSVRVLIKGKQADWMRREEGGRKWFESKTTITPATTRIRYFPPNLIDSRYLNIRVWTRNDSNCLCSLVSIQQPVCPFHGDLGSVKRYGVWSSMLNTSTVIIDTEEYKKGFILVLVASSNDDLCQIVEPSNRCSNATVSPKKRVAILIESNASSSTYLTATLGVGALYVGISLLSIFLSVHKFKYNMVRFESSLQSTKETFSEISNKFSSVIHDHTKNQPAQEGFTLTDGLEKSLDVSSVPVSMSIENLKQQEREARAPTLDRNKDGGDNEEVDGATKSVTDSRVGSATLSESGMPYKRVATTDELMGSVYIESLGSFDNATKDRLRTDLKVTHLSKKIDDVTKTKSIYQKSQLYLGVSLLVSLFYAIPVLQMVYVFSHNQSVTGNQDICYYNDLCRRPLGAIRDFNHVFSNLGYIVFGVLFMLLVYLKKHKTKTFLEENTQVKEEAHGVPQQYGLLFSMGLALAMEGVMSASYHICPTNVTFQFDTTFMYLISIMIFLKLYQLRHADVSANAVVVFTGLAISLILETVSLYFNGPIFWTLFCFTYIVLIVVASVHAYNIGVVRYDYKILYNVTMIFYLEVKKVLATRSGKSYIPKVRSRLLLLGVMGCVNIALCLLFGITGASGASNYLLAIYMLNLFIYFGYYLIMKKVHGESIGFVTWLYMFLALICSLPATYLFTQKEKNSEVSPAESRMMNVECMFLDFYDAHDIWHFLGGSGLFFVFLAILNIDENIKYKRREDIPVF